MADTSKYLPKLLGPVAFADNGTAVNAASTINIIGATIAYDDETDTLDVDVGGGGGSVDLTSDVTGVLPAANGGTGASNLTFPSGPATIVARTTTETLQNKSMSFGSNTFTMTSAQLATACSDETGSGALVFGTNPTITAAAVTNSTSGGTINDCTLGSSAGSLRRLRFTNATGPTITGFDSTGVADGTILRVIAVAGVLAVTHEGAGSSAANRVTLQSGTTINIAVGCFTMFEYDGTSSRWRHLAATAI